MYTLYNYLPNFQHIGALTEVIEANVLHSSKHCISICITSGYQTVRSAHFSLKFTNCHFFSSLGCYQLPTVARGSGLRGRTPKQLNDESFKTQNNKCAA